MQRIWLVLALVLLPCAVWAQADEAPAEDAQPVAEEEAQAAEGEAAVPEVNFVMVPFNSADFGISIMLPEEGRVYDPQTEEWEGSVFFEGKQVVMDPEDMFIWIRTGVAPVALIKGRLDVSDRTQEEFFERFYKQCCKALSDKFLGISDEQSGDGDGQEARAAEEPEFERFNLVTNGEDLEIQGVPFKLYEVEQTDVNEENERLVSYYSIYMTPSGPNVYSFQFGYPKPVDQSIKDACVAILATFSSVPYTVTEPEPETTEAAPPEETTVSSVPLSCN